MAVTSRGIITPDQLDEFEIIADLNVMSASVNSALEDGANTYRGTSAARTSFTSSAPEGTIWVDTNSAKIVWVKQGVSWNRIWPEANTGWLPLSPSSGWSTNAGNPSFIRQIGNRVYCKGYFSVSSGTVPTIYTEVFTIPSVIQMPTTGNAVRLPGMATGGIPVGWDITQTRSARVILNSGLGVNATWVSLDGIRWIV